MITSEVHFLTRGRVSNPANWHAEFGDCLPKALATACAFRIESNSCQ
jgi:hypothetical protein